MDSFDTNKEYNKYEWKILSRSIFYIIQSNNIIY